jgi:pimeloyl-ACP methyl ester carboxylesterase
MKGADSVVLVNGLWLGNVALWPLARRLRRAGLQVYPFSYPSVRHDLHANAERLQKFLEHVPGATVHLVGYSLGGVVIRALFQFHAGQRPGRIVLVASPQQGNQAAAALVRRRFGQRMAGRSVAELLAGIPQTWPWTGRDIGVIAGSRSLGLGRLVADLPAPNDGTVLVTETNVPEARDRLVLPLAHSAMLLSPAVARQVVAFLRTGSFQR